MSKDQPDTDREEMLLFSEMLFGEKGAFESIVWPTREPKYGGLGVSLSFKSKKGSLVIESETKNQLNQSR